MVVFDPIVQAFVFVGLLMFIFDVIALENLVILFLGGFLLLSPWKLLDGPY